MSRPVRKSTKAISSIISGTILFAVLFTTGATYLNLVSTNQNSYLAGIKESQSRVLQLDEETFVANVTLLTNNFLGVTVENTGAENIRIVSIFVTDNSNAVTPQSDPNGLFTVNRGITSPAYNTTVPYSEGTEYVMRVLSERGKMIITTYPPTAEDLSVGGLALVTRFVAGPSPLDEGETVTLNVTVFNYASQDAFDVLPVVDSPYATGTASVEACSGGCPAEGMQDIPAGENRTFTYSYVVHTGGIGGTASFLGYSEGAVAGIVVRTGATLSGPVQIGGFEGSLTNIGLMGVDWFWFKYTSNGNQVLTNVTSVDDDQDYIAFYVRVKNTHNSTLKILKYSFLQLIRISWERSFFIVKDVNLGPNPDTLTAYNLDENSPPGDPNWITIDPGDEVELSFAASVEGGTSWKWATTAQASGGEVPSVLIVMVYLVNGQVRAQTLPFQAVVIVP